MVQNCEVTLYADDTVLYTSNRDFNASIRNLQEDINSLALWCTTNDIKANTDKTKVMVFGSKCTLAKVQPFEIKFVDALLQSVTTYKYLGVTLDDQLNYNLHVTRIIDSVTNKLKQFQRMRSFLSSKAAIMVNKGMILPILEYGNIFFYPTSTVNRK